MTERSVKGTITKRDYWSIELVDRTHSNRKSAVPDRIARTEGYAISQQKRKLIEQGFGWAKLIGPIRQVMVRGLKKQGGSAIRADDGSLQPHAHAHHGANPSANDVTAEER